MNPKSVSGPGPGPGPAPLCPSDTHSCSSVLTQSDISKYSVTALPNSCCHFVCLCAGQVTGCDIMLYRQVFPELQNEIVLFSASAGPVSFF